MQLLSLASIAVSCVITALNPPALEPAGETEPVESLDDAADDPAIWVHPTDPAKSLILGTDKQAGLGVYDLSGKRTAYLREGRLNNVDLRDGFKLGGVGTVSLAVATKRDDASLVFFAVSPEGEVSRLPGSVSTGLGDVYGVAMYHSAKTGRFYAFVCDKGGAALQYELSSAGGSVQARPVRSFHIGSVAEGMAADDEQGALFVSEEQVAFWRYPAEPDDQSPRVVIDLPRPRGNFTPDAEGIAILKTGPSEGYIVLSSQGDSSYNVYHRRSPHQFVTSFTIGPSQAIDGVSDTDGIDICASSLGDRFPAGVFVAQDGNNETQPQNFKLVRLESVREAIRRAEESAQLKK